MSADSANTYTPEENDKLSANLYALTLELEAGAFSSRDLNLAFFCELHRRLFDGVRSHAGKHRARGYGSERVTFGPYRSSDRDVVQSEMDDLFESVRKSLRSFQENPDDPNYERSALHLAVWAHARAIRIHPFEDGNGRTSRLLMGVILVRLGLVPIPVEACKDEYLAALDLYYSENDIEPMLDLLLSVVPTVFD